MGHCDDAHMDEGGGGIILAENGRMAIYTMKAKAFIVMFRCISPDLPPDSHMYRHTVPQDGIIWVC